MHCHDTYSTSLVNIFKSLEMGIRTFDASVSGLGGCPYAPGAGGNVCTEDVVYLLHELGYETGINLNELVKVGNWISKEMDRTNLSRVGKAILATVKKPK